MKGDGVDELLFVRAVVHDDEDGVFLISIEAHQVHRDRVLTGAQGKPRLLPRRHFPNAGTVRAFVGLACGW